MGFYTELNPARPEIFVGSIRDAIRDVAEAHEAAMIAYLKMGSALIDVMEGTIDVITKEHYVSGGSSILTDGVWIWRHDLAYYLERYHLALDPDFVNHARLSGFHVEEPGNDQLRALADRVLEEVLFMSHKRPSSDA